MSIQKKDPNPIPYIDPADLNPGVATIFESLQKSMGMVPSLYRVMAHAPAVLEASQAWTKAITSSQALRMKEIAYLHTSAINHCEYCLKFHRKIAARSGLSETEISQLEEPDRVDWSAFSHTEQNILRFARAWTLRHEIPRSLIDQLVEDLGPTGMVALAATVHQANWTNRFSTLFLSKPVVNQS